MALSAAAPAKLNLYLHVLGRRPDGYHLLDSLVAFADIADEIGARPAPALSLDIAGRFAPGLAGGDKNLVWRAATLLAEKLGRGPGAALRLVKNLPVASGIGGGSSDAAATLKLLLELWQARLDDETLAALGQKLGADVPVCLGARTAWLGGIGESVEPAPPLPPLAVVLVNPGVALPTASVFRRFGNSYSQAARFAVPQDASEFVRLLAARRNDLTPAASELAPVLSTVLVRLAECPGALIVRMSGSGATCFALFADVLAAQAAARNLSQTEPAWWVAPGRLR
jgi:4-diphosphocytidyl-2-C-methyl-D-erythritol kinase